MDKHQAFDSRPCHGFRVAVENESPENLRAMHAAENAMLRYGRIFNGKQPEYRNGFGRGFSRRECRRAHHVKG